MLTQRLGLGAALVLRRLQPHAAASSTLIAKLAGTRPTFGVDGVRSRTFATGVKPIDAEAMAKVTRTWHIIEKDLDTHALKFFNKLFELDPAVRELFSFRGLTERLLAEESGASQESAPMMKKHASSVLKMIGDAASGKYDLVRTKQNIKDLGGRHKTTYNVRKDHFPIMKEALLLTLEEELGGLFTADVKMAWEQAYEQVAMVQQQGMDEA